MDQNVRIKNRAVICEMATQITSVLRKTLEFNTPTPQQLKQLEKLQKLINAVKHEIFILEKTINNG